MRYLGAVLFALLGLVELPLRVLAFVAVVVGTLGMVLFTGIDWQFEPECFEFARRCLSDDGLPPRTRTERNVYD